MGRGLAREEYQYLERPYRDWLPHRRVLGSWVTPPADDSSLVAYRLPINFLGQLPQAGRVGV